MGTAAVGMDGKGPRQLTRNCSGSRIRYSEYIRRIFPDLICDYSTDYFRSGRQLHNLKSVHPISEGYHMCEPGEPEAASGMLDAKGHEIQHTCRPSRRGTGLQPSTSRPV